MKRDGTELPKHARAIQDARELRQQAIVQCRGPIEISCQREHFGEVFLDDGALRAVVRWQQLERVIEQLDAGLQRVTALRLLSAAQTVVERLLAIFRGPPLASQLVQRRVAVAISARFERFSQSAVEFQSRLGVCSCIRQLANAVVDQPTARLSSDRCSRDHLPAK